MALQFSGIHASALDPIVVACPIVSSSTSQVIIKIFISHIILTFPPLGALNFSYSSHGVSSRTLGFSPKYLDLKNSKETIKSMLPKVTHAPASDLFQITSKSTTYSPIKLIKNDADGLLFVYGN